MRANERRSRVDTARWGNHRIHASRLASPAPSSCPQSDTQTSRVHRPALPKPTRRPCSITMSRMSSLAAVASGLHALVELALPVACAACGQPDEPVCPDCRDELARCLWPGGPRRVRPQPCPASLPVVHAAGRYDGPLARIVAAYKDDGRRDSGPLLGDLLAAALDAAVADSPSAVRVLARHNGPLLVVPVPSSAASRRARGDAPLVALAHHAAQGFAPDEAVVADALRPRRRVADQAGLGARQRAVNLEHSMGVVPPWEATRARRRVRARRRRADDRSDPRRGHAGPPVGGGVDGRGRHDLRDSATRCGTRTTPTEPWVNVEPIPVSQSTGVVYRRYMAPLAPVRDTRTGRLGRGPTGALGQGAEPVPQRHIASPVWRWCRG